MNLYLVRHGETEWNRLKKFQGQQDSDLTETGVEQAKKLGEYLKKENIVIDYLYSSPQKRAYETAELLDCNENIIKDDRIKEMAFGKWEGMDIDAIKEESLENYENFFGNAEDYSHEPHGAESLENIEKRVKEFLIDLKNKHMGKNVLVVSHGITLKVFLKIFKNLSLRDFSKSGGIFNTSLSLVKYNGSWEIEYLSKLDHLSAGEITEWLK